MIILNTKCHVNHGYLARTIEVLSSFVSSAEKAETGGAGFYRRNMCTWKLFKKRIRTEYGYGRNTDGIRTHGNVA